MEQNEIDAFCRAIAMQARTSSTPEYEIWGIDDANADLGFATGKFREDCWTIDDARRARQEWQTDGRAAWIVEKETERVVK